MVKKILSFAAAFTGIIFVGVSLLCLSLLIVVFIEVVSRHLEGV